MELSDTWSVAPALAINILAKNGPIFFFVRWSSLISAQVAGAFVLNYPLTKTWARVSSIISPRYAPSLFSREKFSILTARRFPSIFANSRSRACGDAVSPQRRECGAAETASSPNETVRSVHTKTVVLPINLQQTPSTPSVLVDSSS